MSSLRRFRSFLFLAVALFATASISSAAITLNANTSPAAGTVGSTIAVIGTGFPTGTMPGTSVSVLITCPPGNGGAVTVQSSSVLTIANQRTISFQIPAALTTNAPITCQVSVSGTLPAAYNSAPSTSTLTINPPPTISSVTPGAGTRGTTVAVTIVGNFTHFTSIQPTQPSVAVTGAAVTVSSVHAIDATHLTASFSVDPAAVPAMYPVSVKTGSETASIANGFLVAVSSSVGIQISPQGGQQGTTFDVAVVGTNTSFNGNVALGPVTTASFGDTVKVNSITVTDNLHLTANVSVDPIAILGPRTVTVVTGGEYGTLTNGFTVTPSNAALTSILPTGAAQGASTTVTFTGNGTHWTQAGSQVSFGGGIVVGNVVVSNTQSLTASITVPSGTAVGSYFAKVTTNGEIVTLNNAFSVTAATPYLSLVTPTAANQGQANLNVNVTGVFTSFTTGTPTANFGPNVHINSITVTDNTHLTINISVDNTAFAGGRTASLTSNGTIFNFAFTINANPTASITGITPPSGYQGATVAIQVTGANTHWVDGLTTASLDPLYITINRVKVTSATTAEVDINIAANAPVGPRNLQMATGGEIVNFSSFTVLAFTPTMSISPSAGLIGTTVPVVFNGSFTHWIKSPPPAGQTATTVNIDGQGVSITGFTIDTPVSAHASFVIDPTAPIPTCGSNGNRTVTMTTVSGAIDEIVTAGFCVTNTPAYLTSITPYHTAVPVTNLNVTITGANTHFGPTTTVGFGPQVTVSAPFNVTSTSLTVTIGITDPTVALGYRNAYVNTPNVTTNAGTANEQLMIGFYLDYPATSSLLSITPNSGAQGQTLTGVVVTGNLTNWGATTTPILGLGITIANLNVVSANTFTADISISPTTPVGGRNVVVITNGGASNQEVESGLSFSVTPSIASVTAIGVGSDCSLATNCPAPPNTLADLNQGDTKSFLVVGNLTHFLQGETTLDFGAGVSITQVHVVDATHLYGQITVAFNAATGFRTFRATTDGEVAPSFSNAVNIHAVTGTVQITPTTAPQGTTLDITVQGNTTHFSPTNTSATFGNNAGIIGRFGGTSTLSGADITYTNTGLITLHVIVQGTAYCCTPAGYRDFTVTTTGVTGFPSNTEQITLPLAFFITQGAGIITNVTPNSDLQGHSVNLQVTGQNTNFTTGVTTAYLTTGGCNPASPAGAVVTNVTASDLLHATLAVAIDVNAQTGVRGLCMYTLGEFVGYLNAFNVLPGVPTMNSVGPVSGLQGQTLTGVALLGNFTHWTSSGATPTTVTFGQGITVQNLQIVDATHATVDLVIDPLAQTGGRTVTVTTGSEVVSGNLFSVSAGPAILSSINPSHANEGQHILMQINGQFTHWAQGLTQFSIGGGGADIAVNGFLIQNQTTALADLTISPTATPGTRTVTMSTAGEVVSLNQGFLVTGGIPSLLSISPSTYQQCAQNVNVQIAGAYTLWLTGGSPTTVFMGPNITVNSVTVNDDTHLTAIINVNCGAPLGFQSITVQGPVTQQGVHTVVGLPGQVQIISNAPPTPYISYEYPSVALKGQTLSVSFSGAYTNWLPSPNPNATQVTFGAGITVNNFQVTGLNSATANITIQPTATIGNRTVIFTTGAEVETTTFYVTVGTPAISLVDGPNGSSGIQGQTLTVNLVGAYTTWDASMNESNFNFGSGITVTPGSLQIFGPTAVRMQISVDILASLGGRTVIATHPVSGGTETAYGYFGVTASTATITSVSPNTVMQGTSGFVTHVHGFNTHWTNATQFTFGGGDVGVTLVSNVTATDADVTLNLAPLAAPGLRNVTAQTGGEIATLLNGFVVTPGTPILTNCVNCSPSQGVFQQHAFLSSILGQFTSFVSGTTTVDLGNGSHITSITVTGPQSVDVAGTIDPLAYVGCRDVTVTTGAQVLKLYGAFCIGYGPAVISQLSPNTGLQGTTLNVNITGTNSNFCCTTPPNITVANFGQGIGVNTLTITDATHATANITIAANATVTQNSVTLTTQGEIATISNGFTIGNNTPVISFINPTSGVQGTPTFTITLTGSFTHWVNANTTADFGTGVTATVTVIDATHATAQVTVSPIAPAGNHTVFMRTNLSGGGQEIAQYLIGAGNGTPGYFVVQASGATITAVNPVTPASVHQNDNGDIVQIVGSGTHFTLATPVINFPCVGAPVAFTVVDDTHINATINVGTFATTGACNVTVTTGGEVATGIGVLTILPGIPVITQVSANSAHQNDTLSINITGLYTHFTSGFVCAFCGNANVTVNTHTTNSDTSLTLNITISPTATPGVIDFTMQDTADGSMTLHNAFTILAGVPQITGISIPTGPQGLTQNETITGLFTHWSTSSVVTVTGGSGPAIVVGNPPAAPDAYHLNVSFMVPTGASAGPRTVTVTTGAEVVSLPNAFNVLPGSPNLSSLHPNIGVPNSTVTVTLTGVFTHFTAGATTANFGPFISVNGGGFGNNGLLTVQDATDATAVLTIQAGATLGAYNVVVDTPAPPLAADESFTVTSGFTIQSTPATPVPLTMTPPMGFNGTSSATNVPINTQVTITFNEPMLASSISAANAFLTDVSAGTGCWASSGIPAAVSLDLSGRILTVAPTGQLAVGHQYSLQLNSYNVPGGTPTIQDASGTQNLGHYCQYFTTGFAADNTGPTFLTASIPNNATGVPTNAHPVLGFDKAVNPATISALTFMQGATPVNGTWSYNQTYTQYTFTPAATNLTAGTTYTVGYGAALADPTGHTITNPGTLTFTTGAGTDTSGPQVTLITPIYNSTVGASPTLRIVTNKPMNPLTFTDVYVWNNTSGGTNPGSSLFTGNLTWSADFKTFTYTLNSPLPASTQFYWHMCSGYDWVGNYGICFNEYFYTSSGTDTTPPSVVSVSPPNAATGIGVNAPVWVHFSEALDPTAVPANAIRLNGGAVAGSVAFNGSDYTTLIFTPSANLATSTVYNVSVSGVLDTSGNPLVPFAGSSFTTGSSATADTTRGNVTITPTGTNVPVNTNVVFQLNKPVNPVSINSLSMRVYNNTIGHDIPGTVAVSADLLTLTFTPSTSCNVASHCLPASSQVCTWNGNGAYLYDLDGNQFNYTGICFNTSAAADTTAPTVLQVSPPDGATGVGPSNGVAITFSKPVNPGTINTNVAVYTGSSLYTSSYSLSSDDTTVSMNVGTLPYGTTYTVVVSVNVTDLAGNHLASEFRSSFTTAPQPVNTRPQVNTVRPASGATGVPTSSSITFFTSAAMNMATVNANTVHISQNGVLLNGTITPSANNQAITFAPTTPFTGGATIEAWFTSGAQDPAGNPLYDFYAHFVVAPDLSTTPLTISNRTCTFCSGFSPTNKTIEVVFTKPVLPATVTSASFFVKDNSNVNPVNGAITFFNGNRGIRFTPSSPLPVNQYVYVYLTTGIQDVNNLSFAGSSSTYNFYVYTYDPAENTPPFVTGLAPTNGATNIGSNAIVSVTFNENVDSLTLDPANITLTGPGGAIPVSLSYNSNNFTLTVTPQAPMPAGAVTLQLNGVTDFAGNSLNPTPYNSSFTVQNAPDYSGPVITATNIQNGQSNVPVTSSFSIAFNKPIDLRSVVLNNTVYFQDGTLGYQNLPVSISWSAGNTVMLITPNTTLNVNHLYRVLAGCGLADLNGNTSACWALNSNFTTVLVAPSGGPQVTQFVPPNGFTNVPENFKPQIQFDRPIQPTSLAGVTLVKMPGSTPVPMQAQLSASGTLLTIVPNVILLPAVQYQVTVAGVVDAVGNPIAGPVTHAFTTGSSIDLSAPAVVSVTPLGGATVGTNPLLKVVFNEPINPINATNFGMYQYSTGRYVNAMSLTFSADLTTVIFNYPGPLNPNDHYYFYMNSFTDLAGNSNNTGSEQFYTSSSVDNSPLTVTGVNPPNGAAGVPANPAIAVHLSKTIAPTSVNNASVTVSGVANTTVALASDGQTLNVTLPGLLAGNTVYTITVPAGGVTDNSGNAVSSFSSTFTTSASGLSDTTHGGVSLTTPPPGSNGVALNQVITVTFSKPYDPVTVTQDDFAVCINNNCNNRIAGTVALASANTLTFTPAVALPPSSTISVYVYPVISGSNWITDLAGNHFDNPYLYNSTFTTASTVDNTPPSVIGQTPSSGATGVGPYATVALTFNKSLNSSTVNSSNFALYQGSGNLGANVSISSDRRTVYLSQTLPWNAAITISVNTNVQDYAGNSMASPYSSTFNTEPQPLSFNPSVIQTRPGNGAPLNSPITIFTNSQILLSSAQNGLFVAQNGALIPGTVTLTADQHGIVWTPGSNYLPGAYIEAFITNSITDVNNNPINSTSFAFTTLAACATPATTGYAPGRSSYSNYLTNQTVDIQFCGPLNPATVTSSTFFVTAGSGPGGASIAAAGGYPQIVPGTNNTVVRFKAAADWAVNNYYYVTLTNGIQDAGAHAFAGDAYYFYIQSSATHDNTPPAVSTVTPDNGATSIGDNAPIRIVFNKQIDVFTANPYSIKLNNGAIPYTYTFNNNQNAMTITPLAPLPDSSTIAVDVSANVTDYTGAAITDFPESFTTMAGADFSGPVVVSQSIDGNNNQGVPTNTTFSITFNKPLDPSTVSGNPSGGNTCCFFYYDSSCPGSQCYPPSTANLSADQKTVTIVPSQPLSASNGNMRWYWYSGADMNGNGMQTGSQYFTTAAGTDTTPPTVVGTNPVTTATGAPTNTVIEIIFNKPVRATSLGHITLNGAPVNAVLNNSVYTDDQVVKLVPSSLLSPNTLYTVAVQGVQDVAGNTLTGTFTFTFTTGPNFNINSPNFQSATVSTSGGTVALPQNTTVSNVLKTNPAFTFTWDQGIDLGAFIIPNSCITLTDTSNNVINVPLTYTFPSSPNQSTIQVTVNGTLTGSTNYRIWIHYQSYPVSLSGVFDYTQRQFPFTTQP